MKSKVEEGRSPREEKQIHSCRVRRNDGSRRITRHEETRAFRLPFHSAVTKKQNQTTSCMPRSDKMIVKEGQSPPNLRIIRLGLYKVSSSEEDGQEPCLLTNGNWRKSGKDSCRECRVEARGEVHPVNWVKVVRCFQRAAAWKRTPVLCRAAQGWLAGRLLLLVRWRLQGALNIVD